MLKKLANYVSEAVITVLQQYFDDKFGLVSAEIEHNTQALCGLVRKYMSQQEAWQQASDQKLAEIAIDVKACLEILQDFAAQEGGTEDSEK